MNLSFPGWHLQASKVSLSKTRQGRGPTLKTGVALGTLVREFACISASWQQFPVKLQRHKDKMEKQNLARHQVWSAPDCQISLGLFPSLYRALCLTLDILGLVFPDGILMNYPILLHVQGTLDVCLNTSPVMMVQVLANSNKLREGIRWGCNCTLAFCCCLVGEGTDTKWKAWQHVRRATGWYRVYVPTQSPSAFWEMKVRWTGLI